MTDSLFSDKNMYQCQHNCSVEIHDYWNDDLKNLYAYRVNELQLTINGLTLTHNVCQFVSETWRAYFKIICASWTHGKIFSYHKLNIYVSIYFICLHQV